MKKLFAGVLFAILVTAATSTTKAGLSDGDDYCPVPDGGSPALLLACATAGLAGFRFFLKKRSI